MYQIDVTPYPFGVNAEGKPLNYAVKESLVNILFGRSENLTGVQVLERDALGRKIMGSDHILLLEDTEYETIRGAVERFRGFSRQDVDFVKRVLQAEKTKVTISRE